MKQLMILVLGMLVAMGTLAQSPPASQIQPDVNWFPIHARFAPDGSWIVVNLCSNYNPLYCRLVRWEPNGKPQAPIGNTLISGRWSLIAGQEPNKSYIWPSVSWNGKKLAYVIADCSGKPTLPALPTPTDDSPAAAHSLAKLDCGFHDGQPATSESIADLKQGQKIAPVHGATRPNWRPDDLAILYWRTIATVTLASGRSGGVRDIYEYDLNTRVETPKFDLLATRISWSSEATGPFYEPEGKTFVVCGYGFNFPDALGLQRLTQCIQVNSQNVVDVKGLNPLSRSTVFQSIAEDWRGTHWITNGDQIRLVDKTTLLVTDELLNTRLANGHLGNLTPNTVSVSRSRDAVFVNRTFFRSQPIPRRSYWIADGRDAPPAPHLSYYEAQTREVRPVFWPNVDQLN